MIYTLLHPLSAERAVLNGKLLTLIKVGDEQNPDPTFTTGDKIKLVDAVSKQPLFMTAPLLAPMFKDENNRYVFETSAKISYTLINVIDLIPTTVTPSIETEDLIVSQHDRTYKCPWGDICKEHMFKFAKPITKSEFIHLCIDRGYKMVKREEWHMDHTEIVCHNKEMTVWSYKWVKVHIE